MPNLLSRMLFVASRKVLRAYYTVAAWISRHRKKVLRDGPIDTQPECPLFKLPPEIRNQIWELAFASPSTINFVDACPPSKDLALTCRRIYEETGEMYIDAFRSYWSGTLFTIDIIDGNWEGIERSERNKNWDLKKRAAVYAKLHELREEDLAHIENLSMPTSKASSHVFGDPASDMWSDWFPLQGHTDHRAVFLCAPIDKKDALKHSGLGIRLFQEGETHMRFAIQTWEWKDVGRAREIIQSSGLTKDELITYTRLESENDRSWCLL